jgi:hypothetical protein
MAARFALSRLCSCLVPFQCTNQIVQRGSVLVQTCEGATPDVVRWLHEAGAVVRESTLGSGRKCHQGIPSSTEFPYPKGQHIWENIQKQAVSTLSDKIPSFKTKWRASR